MLISPEKRAFWFENWLRLSQSLLGVSFIGGFAAGFSE
jgi:hypothetical protein